MKLIPSGIASMLASGITTFATCVKLTRKDGTVLGFTDHDSDIVFDSVTYKAGTGYSRTAIAGSDQLNPDNVEVESVLDDDSISAIDIRAGKYRAARFEMFLLDWSN